MSYHPTRGLHPFDRPGDVGAVQSPAMSDTPTTPDPLDPDAPADPDGPDHPDE